LHLRPGIALIGHRDHGRRELVEASKAAPSVEKCTKVGKADVSIRETR